MSAQSVDMIVTRADTFCAIATHMHSYRTYSHTYIQYMHVCRSHFSATHVSLGTPHGAHVCVCVCRLVQTVHRQCGRLPDSPSERCAGGFPIHPLANENSHHTHTLARTERNSARARVIRRSVTTTTATRRRACVYISIYTFWTCVTARETVLARCEHGEDWWA